jgi:hypothetical protein
VARSRDEHRAAIIEALDHADEVRQAFAALMQATRRLVDTDFTNPGSSLVRAHVNGALQLTAVNFGGGFGYSASPKNIEHAATKALMDAYAVATQARQATIRDSALGEYHECIAERPRLRHAWDNRTDEELSRAIADEARACLQFVDAAMNAAGEAIVTTAGAAGDPELVSSAQVQQSKMDNLWMQARQALAAGADELTDLERCRDNGSPAILSEAEREAIDTWNVDLVRTLTSLAAGIGIACVHASSPVSTGEACASIAYACVAALAYAVACENAYCAATVAIASERYTTVVEHFGPPTA